MKKILVVKNITREGPGLIAGFAAEAGIELTVCDLSAGEELPVIDCYGGLLVLGGPMSANDEGNHIPYELEYIRKAVSSGVPYLGICLGLQLLVKALGGKVVKNTVQETGFTGPDGEYFLAELTEEGRKDPLTAGLSLRERVFQLHGETVVPVNGMAKLARGKFCEHQIVRAAEKAWGIQCHFELTGDMLTEWATADPDLKLIGTDSLLEQYDSFRDGYVNTCRVLAGNFFKTVLSD